MKIFLLLGVIHILYVFFKRILHEGVRLLSLEELPYTIILLLALSFGIYSLNIKEPFNSLYSWLAIVIYIFGVLFPIILISWASNNILTHKKMSLLAAKIASYLAPTKHNRTMVEMLKSIDSYAKNMNDINKINAIKNEIKKEMDDSNTDVVLVNWIKLLDFLILMSRTEEAFIEYKTFIEQQTFLDTKEEMLNFVSVFFNSIMIVRLMEGAIIQNDLQTLMELFNIVKNHLKERRPGSGIAYIMTGVMFYSLLGDFYAVNRLLKGIENSFPKDFIKFWKSILKSKNNDVAISHGNDLDAKIKKALSFQIDREEFRQIVYHITYVEPVFNASEILREKTSMPKITITLLILMTLFLLTQLFFGGFGSLKTSYMLGANVRYIPLEAWRFFTAWLLHGNIIHFLFNAYAIWVLGKIIERHYGPMVTWILAITSGVMGNLTSYYHSNIGYSLGASSVAFGMLGAGIVMLLVDKKYFNSEWRKETLKTLLFWLVLNIIFGLNVPVIDNAAHFGGLISGGLVGLLGSRSFLSTKLRLMVMAPIGFVLLLGQGWGVINVVKNIVYPPKRIEKIWGGQILIPGYWMKRHDAMRGVYIWNPECTIVPTVKAYKGDLKINFPKNAILEFLNERNLSLIKQTKWKVLNKTKILEHEKYGWVGYRIKGDLNHVTVIQDAYIKRFKHNSFIIVDFLMTSSCMDSVIKEESSILRSLEFFNSNIKNTKLNKSK